MKFIALLLFSLGSIFSFSQNYRLTGTIPAVDINKEMGQITIFSLPDSTLKKGSYIDSSYFSVLVPRENSFRGYAKIKYEGYADTIITFSIEDSIVNLGIIQLEKNNDLETVEVMYRAPMYERTMDGIKVNVDGTTLQSLGNLFEILKASPKLTSSDDESIEIIGKGSPLILIDRQPILTNDELKAIPADMIESIEIITNPSAKYKAQGRSNGVIEVTTKDFKLQGYNMNLRLSGGVNTQKKPTGSGGLGLSYKKKQFSLNAYVNFNYRSQNSFGYENSIAIDSTSRTASTNTNSDSWNIWQHGSIKMSYQINKEQKLTAGFNAGGSLNNSSSTGATSYFQNDTLETIKELASNSKSQWSNNSAFVNYFWQTDTNKSNLEINLNYRLKINEGVSEYRNTFEDVVNANFSDFDVKNDSRNRPNVGELRVTYEHVFDTSGWKLSAGGAYSIVYNGKRFDQSNWINANWEIDPIYSNSYDYVEQIGSVFAEVTKKWKKIGLRAGITGEYTNLNGYSNSLNQQFMDSVYILPFPSISIMLEPAEKLGITLKYSSGIDRPNFSNYDPFVQIQDSFSIQYGNPYLRPVVEHSFGLDFDIFYTYGFGVNYSVSEGFESTLSFIDDSTFLRNSTPWNADRSQRLSANINLPIKTKWMSGWNSIWFNYNKYEFTDVFVRPNYSNVTFGLWSYLNFYLPGNLTLTNRVHASRWGGENFLGKLNVNWGLKLTKKTKNNNFQIYVEVSDIIPPKYQVNYISSNYTTFSENQYAFTNFSVGLYYKFGRLKQDTSIKESSSGQGSRI